MNGEPVPAAELFPAAGVCLSETEKTLLADEAADWDRCIDLPLG
jgi:hypothetical protein